MADFAVNIVLRAQDEATATVRRLGTELGKLRGGGGRGGARAAGGRGGRGRSGFMGTVDFDAHRFAARLGGASANIDRLTSATRRAVGAPIELAMNFEQSMKEVRAVTGDAQIGANFEALTTKARELGRDTEFTAEQVAQGLKFMGIAGLDTSKQLETISPLLDAATVSGLELGRTSDVITDVMGGFGLVAGEKMANGVESARFAVDSMIATTLNANTNLDQLAQGLFKVGPLAKKVGVEFNEVNAMLGVLASAGIKGAEGGTALRNIMLSLTGKPSKDMRKLLKELGLKPKELRAALGERGLAGTMDLLMHQMKDLDAPMQLFASNVLFNRRTAVSATNILDKLSGEYDGLKDKIDGSTGASKAAADEFRSSTKSAVTQLKSAISDLGIEVGDGLMPVLRPLIGDAKEAVKQFSAWAKENPDLVRQLGKAAFAVIGLGTVLSPALLAASSLVSTITFGAQAFKIFGGALNLASGPMSRFTGFVSGTMNPNVASMVGSTTGKLGILGAVASAALAGYQFGQWADETFELSNKLAGMNKIMAEQISLQLAQAKIRGAASLGDMTEEERSQLKQAQARKESLFKELEQHESEFSFNVGPSGIPFVGPSRSEHLQEKIAAEQATIDRLNQQAMARKAFNRGEGTEGGKAVAGALTTASTAGDVERMMAQLKAAIQSGMSGKLEVEITDGRPKVKRAQSSGVELSVESGVSPGGL